MKKLFTLLLVFSIFFGLTQTVDAQSQRMVVVEEATNASCPPCASQNPPLQALLNQNTDKAIFIAYQVWWPGYDAMYLDNQPDVDWRIGDYYTDITGAPNIKIQGTSSADLPSALTQNVIDGIHGEMSEFDITMSASIDNGVLNINGTIDGTATYDAAGDLRLRLVVTEDVIYNEDLVQIGTNGETEFHHVFKKFVGGTDGLDLADNWVDGDTYSFMESYDLSQLNIYHYDGIEVVALIQDEGNKYIPQAAKVSGLPITVATDINSSANDISGLPEMVCSGDQTITPSVKIQNSGNNDLTSLDIVYDVNGGTPQTFSWTGSLGTLSSETVTLDPISFVAGDVNTINVSLENPNGSTDEDLSDNTSSADMSLAPHGLDQIIVTLNTDCWPEETSWDIKDGAGMVVASGGSYDGMAETEIIDTVMLAMELDCYEVGFYDTYGDGLNGSQWPSCSTDGSFVVTDIEGTVLFDYDGSYEASEINAPFEAAGVVGVTENILNNEFTLAPNPVSDVTSVGFTLPESAETMIRVFNVAGQEVLVKNLGLLGAGTYQEDLSLIDLNPGIYFVNLTSGNNTGLKKVTVMR